MDNIRHHKNSIKVYGTGYLEAAPDIATIYMSVITQGEDVVATQNDNNKITTNVIKQLRSLGVPMSNIETINYSVSPIYEYIDNKQVFKGYKVKNTLAVKTTELNQVGTIIDKSIAAGVNSVSTINYDLSDIRCHYQEALRLALIDAKDKAYVIASTICVLLNDTPYQVNELIDKSQVYQMESRSYEATPIIPSKIQIRANVEVYFNY